MISIHLKIGLKFIRVKFTISLYLPPPPNYCDRDGIGPESSRCSYFACKVCLTLLCWGVCLDQDHSLFANFPIIVLRYSMLGATRDDNHVCMAELWVSLITLSSP